MTQITLQSRIRRRKSAVLPLPCRSPEAPVDPTSVMWTVASVPAPLLSPVSTVTRYILIDPTSTSSLSSALRGGPVSTDNCAATRRPSTSHRCRRELLETAVSGQTIEFPLLHRAWWRFASRSPRSLRHARCCRAKACRAGRGRERSRGPLYDRDCDKRRTCQHRLGQKREVVSARAEWAGQPSDGCKNTPTTGQARQTGHRPVLFHLPH